jgi:hypothetical protein
MSDVVQMDDVRAVAVERPTDRPPRSARVDDSTRPAEPVEGSRWRGLEVGAGHEFIGVLRWQIARIASCKGDHPVAVALEELAQIEVIPLGSAPQIMELVDHEDGHGQPPARGHGVSRTRQGPQAALPASKRAPESTLRYQQMPM